MSSPFIIVQDFLSPLACEDIVKKIKVKTPDVDIEGKPIKSEQFNSAFDNLLAEKFDQEMINTIEQTYDCQYLGLHKPVFQFYPERPEVPAEMPGCENSKYIRRKWVMHKENVDLVGFIWLNDFNNQVPIDTSFEVYGGKLEFPAFNFSFVPQRGTLIIFPAGPHFITAMSPILVGSLYQIKLNFSISEKMGAKWFYQPAKHPGTWQEWLNEHL